jgi:hypothetical protein
MLGRNVGELATWAGGKNFLLPALPEKPYPTFEKAF